MGLLGGVPNLFLADVTVALVDDSDRGELGSLLSEKKLKAPGAKVGSGGVLVGLILERSRTGMG